MRETHFTGWMWEGVEEELFRISIEKDGEYVNVWLDSDIADDIESIDDLRGIEGYENKFYYSVQDFRDEKSIPIEEVWPE